VLSAKRTVWNSILKMRLGAEPEVEVKIPQPFVKAEQPLKATSVRRSCHKEKMV
jgi:hypothetical protein